MSVSNQRPRGDPRHLWSARGTDPGGHLRLAVRRLARRLLPAGSPPAQRARLRGGADDLDRDQRLVLLTAAPHSYATWRDQTPDDFVFAVKGGRFITHMLKLRGVETALANFFASGVLALGPKLGPVLWQLPAHLPYDAARLEDFFAQLPRTTTAAAELAKGHDEKVKEDRALTVADAERPIRHVLEFRSDTYCTDESFDLMRRHDIGCVVADTAGKFPKAEVVTSDVVYVRLHGDTELYASGYSPEALDHWAAKCRERSGQGDVYVYFDNDAKGFAPHDALSLLDRLG